MTNEQKELIKNNNYIKKLVYKLNKQISKLSHTGSKYVFDETKQLIVNLDDIKTDENNIGRIVRQSKDRNLIQAMIWLCTSTTQQQNVNFFSFWNITQDDFFKLIKHTNLNHQDEHKNIFFSYVCCNNKNKGMNLNTEILEYITLNSNLKKPNQSKNMHLCFLILNKFEQNIQLDLNFIKQVLKTQNIELTKLKKDLDTWMRSSSWDSSKKESVNAIMDYLFITEELDKPIKRKTKIIL